MKKKLLPPPLPVDDVRVADYRDGNYEDEDEEVDRCLFRPGVVGVTAMRAAGRAVAWSRWATTMRVAAESRTRCHNVVQIHSDLSEPQPVAEEIEDVAAAVESVEEH